MTGSTATSDSAFRSWDVVVVPFPYSERLAEKRRPALVVSSAKLHRNGFLWLAMITGAGKDQRDGDIELEDLAAAGLPGASMVRASKIATAEPARIVRRIGSVATPERKAIAAAIAGFLAKA